MNDNFEKKVRAAAVAGWWVILVAVGFLTLLWLVFDSAVLHLLSLQRLMNLENGRGTTR
jgi:hypothetical protein